MGTKANPGAFDCYEDAGIDEPIFYPAQYGRIGAGR